MKVSISETSLASLFLSICNLYITPLFLSSSVKFSESNNPQETIMSLYVKYLFFCKCTVSTWGKMLFTNSISYSLSSTNTRLSKLIFNSFDIDIILLVLSTQLILLAEIWCLFNIIYGWLLNTSHMSFSLFLLQIAIITPLS